LNFVRSIKNTPTNNIASAATGTNVDRKAEMEEDVWSGFCVVVDGWNRTY
jgi:hypothetical protein